MVEIPVGKFIGVIKCVMEFAIKSGSGLDRATDPLSPITNTLKALRSFLTIALISLMILEFVPPQSPLSVVIGTSNVFLTATGDFFF